MLSTYRDRLTFPPCHNLTSVCPYTLATDAACPLRVDRRAVKQSPPITATITITVIVAGDTITADAPLTRPVTVTDPPSDAR